LPYKKGTPAGNVVGTGDRPGVTFYLGDFCVQVQVETARTRKELREFVLFPEKLYRGDARWVAPLRSDVDKTFDSARNPFFDHGEIVPLLARRSGRVVGRIAAIRNTLHESFHRESVGFFGFFECENDPEAAAALVAAAAGHARSWGLSLLRGPVNPDTNGDCGLLVDGFGEAPMVMMSHARPYYDSLLRGCGLEKARDLVAYIVEENPSLERFARVAALVARRRPSIRVRRIDMRRLEDEVARFKKVYNRAWEKNWGFVPMTDIEVDHMARELRRVIDPGFVVFAEENGEPIGVALALPDFNQAIRHARGRLFPVGWIPVLWHSRRIRQVRVLALGLVPEAKGRGVDVLLYNALYSRWVELGYRRAELSWILEDNLLMRAPLESIGGRVYKTYRIYEGNAA
jgi:GNAT superfamily N-acetyltransferase